MQNIIPLLRGDACLVDVSKADHLSDGFLLFISGCFTLDDANKILYNSGCSVEESYRSQSIGILQSDPEKRWI